MNETIMNIYYIFYCRAYDWYNTNGKKSKDTLRGSAIALLAAMPTIHCLTALAIWSLINKHTPLNKWLAVLFVVGLLVFNWLLISPEKSDALRAEYQKIQLREKKRINFWFYFYLILSTLILIIALGYVAYYKNKYGNYDE